MKKAPEPRLEPIAAPEWRERAESLAQLITEPADNATVARLGLRIGLSSVKARHTIAACEEFGLLRWRADKWEPIPDPEAPDHK